mmetsp:Transcript_13735/g.29154  ORF Transcript_13735/g.29154 Transcript_13735/m.29154 type:complete len:700 (+) Transcript_13735:119-2218(+)
MRARNENDVLSVHAIAGTHVVLLGLDVKGYESPNPESSTDLSGAMTRLTLDSDSKEIAMAARDELSSIKVKNTSRKIFVGFAIDRRDVSAGNSVSLNFDRKPIQKFHHGDYTVLPGRQYEYTIRRMIQAPRSYSSSSKFVTYGSPVVVTVSTEDPTTGKHGIYFNRGVAGSKAYSKKFGEYRKYHLVNKFGSLQWKPIINPRSISDPEESKRALAWLSRGLEEALIQFISQADGKEYRLLATVYEFTHEETIQAFASAVERGVDVKIVRHCKGSYHPRVKRNDFVKDGNGKVIKDWIPDDPTQSAKETIDKVGFNSLEHAHIWQHDTFIERKHSAGIMHNKFIILVKNGKPMQVWTGSANPTDGGIYGQSNVGHIVRDDGVASQYLEYWERLSQDLPGRKHLDKKGDKGGSEPMDESNEQQQPDLENHITPQSIHVIFSPRKNLDMLQWYADQMKMAAKSVHYTAAFGVAQPIAEVLNQGQSKDISNQEGGLRRSPRIASRCKVTKTSAGSLLRYVLLDNKPSQHSSEKKRCNAEKKGTDYADYYDFRGIEENRVAFGAILPTNGDGDDNANECGESLTGLTTFVDYIHTKYMIVDALTNSPLVITGSANFSAASTDKNDENSLVIQGDTSVADIYFTEFMRLFDHFYSRDKYNEFLAKNATRKPGKGKVWGEVVADESWLRPYFDPSSQLYRERLLLR